MTDKELAKAYEPKSVDNKWYQFWIENKVFTPDPLSPKPAYSIVMPPPNVTGVLHMGHALVNTLQDVLIRWKRMSGFETLWVPGTDHAGIATQTVVERHLLRTLKKRRTDFSREEFLKHVWLWKEENEHNILNQLKKLGCSCDWSRCRFTMDAGNNAAVRKMFKKLYDDGLIYQGDYLVNWDPLSQTALSDDEVEYEEKEGFLWHFHYALEGSEQKIEIATTRPETMLGDVAIAVSPKDPRYLHLIGQFAIQPITGRRLPIIGDSFVDPEFGTGAVKITPAHDLNDYKLGIAQSLPFINIMTPDGRINEEGKEYQGMTMLEAREAIIKKLKEDGFFVKASPHVNRVSYSYRSKAVIEPYLSKQWFVKMSDFKSILRNLVDFSELKIVPNTWENTYFHWIDQLRDWCISRQLWWGHRIPIWYKKSNPEEKICFEGEGLPPEVSQHPDEWEQDTDVLDTWFSSALWPFSTLGWPNKTPELEKFYPNSTLVTGHDILFFWVARMLAMGTYALGKAPFPETFLHGLIYGKSYWKKEEGGNISYVPAEERVAYDLGKPTPPDVAFKWEKMSKSKGNVIDPLEIIEEYGTDATRMALCASATQAREIDLDRRRFEEYRNFTNKIWNGARFVLMNLIQEDPSQALSKEDLKIDLSFAKLEDRWIFLKLLNTIKEVNQTLTVYQFDQAATSAYDFFWKEFCAFYVEFSKPYLFGKIGTQEERKNKQKILLIILTQAIRLLHPMAPFITEELFQILKRHFGEASEVHHPLMKECILALQAQCCAVTAYPQEFAFAFSKEDIEKEFNLLEQVIYTLRNLRGEMKLPPSMLTKLIIQAETHDPLLKIIKNEEHLIGALIRLESISYTESAPLDTLASMGVVENLKLIIPLPDELKQVEKIRLIKEIEKLHLNYDKLKHQLSNPLFVEKAPPALIEKQKDQLKQMEQSLTDYQKKLTYL